MLFRGTAWYYARFRPGYAPELIELLAARAGLDEGSRVLDLGTGTGQLAVPLAAHAGEVVAVDPEPEMLARIDAAGVRTVEARAEEVDETWGRFDLVTIGNAFHWMDPAILDRLPTDQVALCGVEADRQQQAARELAEEMLGPRPALRQPTVRYETTLAASAFADVEELRVEVERTWSVDELVGLAFSTSFASPVRLGER